MDADGFTLGPMDVKRVARRYLLRLEEQREALDRLNVYPVPDGDTGTNMALTMESTVAETDRAHSMGEVAAALAHGSLMGAQGNSGIILAEILRELGGAFDGHDAVHSGHLGAGLDRAAQAAYRAVGRPQEGTILTVLRASASAAGDGVRPPPEPLAEFAGRVYEAAAETLRATPEMLPVLKEAGVVDAGGAGYLLLLAALLEEVTGRAVDLPAELARGAAARVGDALEPDELADLRYEVVFLLDGEAGAGSRLMERWRAVGNSIVVVGGEGMWSCHIHTNDVGAALEAGVEAGRPHRVRVTDLRAQAADEAFHRDTSFRALDEARAARIGVVAVAVGRGAIDLFRAAGVQGVVIGGQTMNPPVRDLLEVVEAVPAQIVVVLPNNRNVIPAAEQLDTLTKKRVVVVPTRSVPEGLAALIEYSPAAADVGSLAEAMAAAAARVTTAEVVRAVRDATTPSGPVRAGDWLGLVNGTVRVVVRSRPGFARRLLDACVGLGRRATHRALVADRHAAASLERAVRHLMEEAVGEGSDLVTVITGAGAITGVTEAAERWLAHERPGVPVEVLSGGQPFHPYVIGVE